MKNDFHDKDCNRRIALKQTLKRTRRWPIGTLRLMFSFCHFKQIILLPEQFLFYFFRLQINGKKDWLVVCQITKANNRGLKPQIC